MSKSTTCETSPLYGTSLALLTDLYQLTMAQGYLKAGLAERPAVFHLFFRRSPFQGGYAVAAGLGTVIEQLSGFHFDSDDVEYLRSLVSQDGTALFNDDFLHYLSSLELSCDLDAMPEGTVVFPHEPLVRVTGPLIQCQLLETFLLNVINFQTLIATRAARICGASQGEPVLEFGLRRAQGIDGGLSASRAAYIGGCAATSNVLAGKLYQIPVRGTHAHSWVMSFDDEVTAFREYSKAMPNNCVFLVDTYDTLQGVRHAIAVGKELRRDGHDLLGIRLDSGDLAWLSIEARKMLDAEGFPNAVIVASNDLDEHLIESLKHQGAKIAVWGVGTKLATAYDQPALGGVYKLAALQNETGEWEPRIKLSEQRIKISNPGTIQVRRFNSSQGADSKFCADLLFDECLGCPSEPTLVDPLDGTRQRKISLAEYEDLLVPIYRSGNSVYELPDIHSCRKRTQQQITALDPTIRRLQNPHEYPVGLERQLYELKMRLIAKARQQNTIPEVS